MNKYDLVTNIIENPEQYGDTELYEFFRDPEIREIYNKVCKIKVALVSPQNIDLEKEWELFKEKLNENKTPKHYFRWFDNRAASLIAVICASLLAIATGIGITISISKNSKESTSLENTFSDQSSGLDKTYIDNSSLIVPKTIQFEDAALIEIMDSIAINFHVNVNCNNEMAKDLLLYYKLDTSLPLEEIISQLNTFEQINIKKNGNDLIIE